jgi:hypothetical protein
MIILFLLQNKDFKLTTVLLFDSESGLRSKKAQSIIAEKYNITVRAEAFYKRNMAERAIKEKINLEQLFNSIWKNNRLLNGEIIWTMLSTLSTETKKSTKVFCKC